MESLNEKRSSIIALGNPIVDISAPFTYFDIKKYKMELGQTYFYDENNKGFFDELEEKKEKKYSAGGAIENSLRVCGWCLNINEQNKTDQQKKDTCKYRLTMLGCIGKDENGKRLIQTLEESGVYHLFEVNPNAPTSTAGIAVCDKERAFVSNIQASTHLSKNFVEEHINEILEHDILLIEGFFIKENYDLVLYLASQFKAKNKIIMMTLSSKSLVEEIYFKIHEIACYAHLIFCNKSEARALSRVETDDVENIATIVHRGLKKLNRHLIITCRAKGVSISKFDYKNNIMDYYMNVYSKFIKYDEIVDLKGIGDAFVGGFLSEFVKNSPNNICAKAGNAASGYVLKCFGCDLDPKIKFKI